MNWLLHIVPCSYWGWASFAGVCFDFNFLVPETLQPPCDQPSVVQCSLVSILAARAEIAGVDREPSYPSQAGSSLHHHQLWSIINKCPFLSFIVELLISVVESQHGKKNNKYFVNICYAFVGCRFCFEKRKRKIKGTWSCNLV